MAPLPTYIYLVFGLTVVAAVCLFARATHYNKWFLIGISAWLVLRSVQGLSASNATTPAPSRPPFLLLVPIVAVILLFNTVRGKAFIDGLSLRALSIFHVVRIPVELVLFWLFAHKAIPELMTFEGRNFDIISGLSAPIIYYIAFANGKVNKPLLWVWNLVCLALVLNIVFYSVLSAPTKFQQFAFDQPNLAIGRFPFALLPGCIVPLVLLAHLASIRQLLNMKSSPIESKIVST